MSENSPSLRDRKAQLTRDEILRAARNLFAEQGYARITRSILEHCGYIVHALVTGAAAEPELAAVLAEGQRRHVEGAGRIVGLLRQLDALGSIDPDEAVKTLAALTDIRFALVLQESYGWSLDRLESWMAATSRTLLLGQQS